MPQENNTYNNNNRRASKPQHISQFDHGGRIPPRDNDLEEAVLGALMLEKDAYTVVCDILKPESFYDPANQKIYAAIQTLGAAQQSIDMLTVTERLRLNGDLEGAGGALRISELTSKVASGAHVEFHARIVAQKSPASSYASPRRSRPRPLTRAMTWMTCCRKPRANSSRFRSATSRRM